MTASTEEEYLAQVEHFCNPDIGDRPILFEVFTNNTDEDEALPRTFTVELPGDVLRTVYLLDSTHDMTACETIAPDCGSFRLTMQPNTVVVIR